MKTVVPPSTDPEFGVAEVKLRIAGAAAESFGVEATPPPQPVSKPTSSNQAVPAIQSRSAGRYSDLERLIITSSILLPGKVLPACRGVQIAAGRVPTLFPA